MLLYSMFYQVFFIVFGTQPYLINPNDNTILRTLIEHITEMTALLASESQRLAFFVFY